MLLYTGIILTVLLGFAFVNCISVKFSLTEKIGLSFPIGMALQTLLMLFLNLLSIKLTANALIISEFILTIALYIPLFLQRKEFLITTRQSITNHPFKNFNLVWLFFIVAILYLEYMNFSKCMYFPPYDRDSLAGFETIGYVIAQEHTLKGLSLFQEDYIQGIHGAASYITYAPMVQLSYAYVYTLGAATSKIIPGLLYLFFLIAFYGATCRITRKTGAAIATFFMLLTPEMLAFSSLSMTNVIHAIYASLGIIYIALWFRNREQKDLLIGGILLGINMWCRTEGIVFIGAALCIVFIDSIRKKKFKDLIICTVLTMLPTLCWVIFSKINGLYAESIAITRPFWDAEKIDTILTYMLNLYKNTIYYGWSFTAFVLAFIANIWFLIKKKDSIYILSMIILASLFYMIVLYQIDYKWDSIQNVLSYSAKRFMFCFIPLLWYFVLTNQACSSIIKKLDNLLALKK